MCKLYITHKIANKTIKYCSQTFSDYSIKYVYLICSLKLHNPFTASHCHKSIILNYDASYVMLLRVSRFVSGYNSITWRSPTYFDIF